MKRRGACASWVLAACLAGALSAAPTPVRAEPGDDLTIAVLTFGPGDHPFFKFGHNAIVVQAPGDPGWVFNFGTFSFDSPALIPKFLRGRFKYWLSVATLEETVASYAAANRSVLWQELALGAAEKLALAQALRINARPENREYLYDYFRDNCSTRVRDAIDRAAGGRLQHAGRAAGVGSFRFHALRMVSDLWPEYVGIHLGLGRAADAPITRWGESFLPERLADLLRAVQVADGSGARPLVKSERVLHRAARPDKPAQPPSWGEYFLLLGLVLGAGSAGLGWFGRRSRWGQIGLGAMVSVVGGVFGLLGIIMLSLWLFTDHRIAYANANILQFAPWAVLLVGYGVAIALGRPRALLRARWLVVLVAGGAAVGVLAKLLPGANQVNGPFILLCLPVWLGMWVGLRQVGPKES